MVPFAPCNDPGSNRVGSLTAGGQNVQCMEQLQMELSDCQQKSNQVLKNPTGSLGAPTIMQLSHWDRNRHPPQYLGSHQLDSHMPNLPHGPISHYLSSFTASYIRGTGHPLLNSTLSPHTTSPPAGELPAATLPGMNGVVTKLDLSMWSGTLNWS